MARDWDLRADELAAHAMAEGRPTAWFEQLYAEGEAGTVSMPWDRDYPHPLFREWLEDRGEKGAGRRAVVVGCGLGADAEHLAEHGFATTGFDVSATAVRLAAERYPASAVDYRVADLMGLPLDWRHAFDLVVEVFTVQALPDPPRSTAMLGVAGLVAPGGSLLAVAFRAVEGDDPTAGPPFSLTRDDMEHLATGGLILDTLEELDGPRWRATYHR